MPAVAALPKPCVMATTPGRSEGSRRTGATSSPVRVPHADGGALLEAEPVGIERVQEERVAVTARVPQAIDVLKP